MPKDITLLSTSEFLNLVSYPTEFDNARRKAFPLYDQIALVTGDTSRYFFNQDLGNQFARNKKFPNSGQEVFFATEIEMFLNTTINTAALYNAVNDLMQRGNLQIILSDRSQITIPLYQVLNFPYQLNIGNNTQPYGSKIRKAKRKLVYPIIINSLASIDFKINVQSIPAALNNVNFRLKLNGIQFDKLSVADSDFVQNNQFQNIDFTFYDSQLITTGAQTTYNLFQNSQQDKRAVSKVLPMSGIDRAQVFGLEVYVPGTDADTDFLSLLYNNRQNNVLTITVDDVIYFQSDITDFLSLGAVRGSTFTDVTPTNTAYVNMAFKKQYLLLNPSIVFPANGKVSVTLQQPASSIPAATNYITTIMDSVILRRVV